MDGGRLRGASFDDGMRGGRRFDAARGDHTKNEEGPRPHRQAGEDDFQRRAERFDRRNSDTIGTAELSKQPAFGYRSGK